MTEFGEQSVMKVSLTLRQRLRAMDSASGMFSKMLYIITGSNLCKKGRLMRLTVKLQTGYRPSYFLGIVTIYGK